MLWHLKMDFLVTHYKSKLRLTTRYCNNEYTSFNARRSAYESRTKAVYGATSMHTMRYYFRSFMPATGLYLAEQRPIEEFLRPLQKGGAVVQRARLT